MNKKQTSVDVGSLASSVLRDKNSSQTAKQLAASALSQTNTNNQTGLNMEVKAGKVLQSSKYNDITRTLAASVLTQSN